MTDLLRILLVAAPAPSNSPDPLSLGLRIGAIVIVIAGSYALGRWLQAMVTRIPAHGKLANPGGHRDADVQLDDRTIFSRWLGTITLVCVMVAGIAAAVVIAYYGQPGTNRLDLQQALKNFENHIAPPLISTLLLAAITLAGGRVLQSATIVALQRARLDFSLQLLSGRIIYVTALIVGAIIVLSVWGISPVVPTVVLSVITVGLGLALQDVLRNLFAGVYLLVERPFVIGDKITVATFTGRVMDIQLRVTSLRTADGQEVLVPNAMLFTSAVVNATPTENRPVGDRRSRFLRPATPVPAASAADFDQRVVLGVSVPDARVDAYKEIAGRLTTALGHIDHVLLHPAPEVMLNHAGGGKLDLRVTFYVPAEEARAAQGITEAVNRACMTVENAEVSVMEPASASAS